MLIFFLRRPCILVMAGLTAAAAIDTKPSSYEVWASDQSNTVEGQDALGVKGSLLWIWNSTDINAMLQSTESSAAAPEAFPNSLPCSPDAETGPCNLFTIFPETLTDSVTGEVLSDAAGFGRWHGITKDPQNKYVTANIFAPGGGYLGIVDAETKGAVGLFRVTEMTYTKTPDANATTRNVHMSFWNDDGSAILVHNLAGKALERINVERDAMGKISSLAFDKSATLGFGKAMQVSKEASFYEGNNAFSKGLLGGVTGSYDDADLGDLTPTGVCKENGCAGATTGDGSAPGRPNNVPICPVMASNGKAFNTMGGGGVLVADTTKTPMSIVGAYGNSVVHGAGVCGEQVGTHVYFTSGVSASGAGADQSMFTVYAMDPSQYTTAEYQENLPAPIVVMDDGTGTATGGKTVGNATNYSGQLPGSSTRRDAHDVAGTVDGKYVHVIDRIQNVVEVFDAETHVLAGTYDLTTRTGVVGDGTTGPCSAASVTDGGESFPLNDPAPDFIDPTPDGKFMIISFRGPAPVSAGHAAQGSCPGVGVVELKEGGASGALVGVLRSVNTVTDNAGAISPTGGATYDGAERSDIHDAVVIFKGEAKESESSSAVTQFSGGACFVAIFVSALSMLHV